MWNPKAHTYGKMPCHFCSQNRILWKVFQGKLYMGCMSCWVKMFGGN